MWFLMSPLLIDAHFFYLCKTKEVCRALDWIGNFCDSCHPEWKCVSGVTIKQGILSVNKMSCFLWFIHNLTLAITTSYLRFFYYVIHISRCGYQILNEFNIPNLCLKQKRFMNLLKTRWSAIVFSV